MKITKKLLSIFILSPEVLCTQGIDHINSGIRIGDSGGALNLEENGRLMLCHLPSNFVFEVKNLFFLDLQLWE